MTDWFGGSSGEQNGSQKPTYNNPKYAPPAYDTPFGSWSYDGNKFTSTMAPQEKKQLDLSQSAYYDIMKNLPTDGPMGSASLNNYNNPNSYLGAYNKAYTDVLDSQYGVPLRQKNAGQYGGDSTIGRYAENDLNTKIGNQGILNTGNLANTNYNSMLAGMTGVGSNINDIYKRMMGVAAQGRGQGQDYMINEQTNATRDFTNYLKELQYWDEMNQGNTGAMGGIASMLGLGGGDATSGSGGIMNMLGGDNGFINQLMGMFGSNNSTASPTGSIDSGYGAGYGSSDDAATADYMSGLMDWNE